MITTEEHILKKLKDHGRGKIFFPEHFYQFGSQDAVHQALSRLADHDTLVRLGQGIYLYPKIDPRLGILQPDLDSVATAIAKRDKATIIPTGALALNKLGLSTQVPMNSVYLTDGSARSVRIGNRKIKFKRSVPKNLKVRGKISGLIIQALKEIGKDKVTNQQLSRINELLLHEDPEHLKHDAKLAPVWIRKIIEGVLEEK